VIKLSVGRLFLMMGLMLIGNACVQAQVITGTPPFGSFGGGPDIINLANLNSHIPIPIITKAGRGTAFTYNLSYDTSIWNPVTTSGVTTWTPVTNLGWHVQTEPTTGYVRATSGTSATCTPPLRGEIITASNWVYHDTFGVPHPFAGTAILTDCGGSPRPLTGVVATDGSGYTLTTGPTLSVTSRTGIVFSPPFNAPQGVGSFADVNGNEISVSSTGVFTDTLGTTALTVAGNATASSPVTFTYTPPSGTNVAYTMNYTSYTVATNFGVSGITEYGATALPLVSSIVLPDGTQYTFTYEATPSTPSSGACTPLSGTYAANCITGRLASITLPTGGAISYTYSGGNNGILSDGTAATLTRKTPDTGSNSWTYAHSESGTAWTTTLTDPQNNQTVLNFQGIYETERQVYQGSGALLKTTFTCYNGAAVPCNSTAITLPIASRAHYVQWPGGLESETNTTYNTYGLVTEKDQYAYGAGAPGAIVRKTLTTYASLGNGIVSKPATVTVEDGSSNVHSQTTYTYDQGSVTATSSTPQHVAISGSRGNLTTISYLVQGSTSLNRTYTYYDTGNLSTATDVNGAVTTYTYGGGTSCGNSFATSVSEPLGLSRSMTWNCTGGVPTSVTDENGKTSATSYTDPDFWRPFSVTDAASNVANFTYEAQTSVEGAVNFGNSTTDVLTTGDGLGRSHVSQRKEAPSSSTYDSVETDYDSVGRPARTTLPYAAAAGTLNSSAPGTTTTYDALNRKTQVTATGGRSVTYAYSQNDTYRTLGPAPAGENTKRKQLEYDALGRMTSVCEITSATGSGSCGQTGPATGFVTQYTYDSLNDLIGVTQNAQSASTQTRTYVYDDLGRLTSEKNPESGVTTYTYDTDATCGTSKGDLVKKIDAQGNTICYAYDLRHRVTSTTYTGPYSVSTPNRYFVYDGATVNSVAMANAKARIAEAYTSTCQTTCTKITDLGFSYDVLGEPTDVYEATAHSGGYYHVTNSYYANGVVSQLSSLVGLPTITYGVDGEGRVNSASASTGQNPLTAANYNPASEATGITFGSTDSDSFTYDPNTNRMTQYKFSVNGQSVTGTLTWNAISTLETLAITDPFYGEGNQSCAYTHDDLSRIASANCGSPWSQTFGYDAFGNLSKTGTVSFQPTYSYLTNQMTAIGTSSVSYDANGNVLSDTAHTYTWDANGRPVTIDGAILTYDALGRMVEQDKSGVFTEIAYAPTGGKLAIMSGQTLQKAFVPLPGGSTAVYASNGLAYYRHSDWIGSSRFASTPGRALYFDGAYAPFGENYAQTGTTDLSFTGMNQDTVPNLFDFPAREYNGIHGRWPSPDPSGLSAVRPGDPQTFNRYAYVRNSPLHMTDPTGLSGETFVGHAPRPASPTTRNGGGGGGEGGGGSDDGCQQDGVATSCSIVENELQSGAAVQCPNNECQTYSEGEFWYFNASANGNGAYFPSEGPGYTFDNLVEAEAAGAQWAAAETADNGVENCGMTYSDSNGGFSFTGSTEGNVGGVCSAKCSKSYSFGRHR
jgi:RHS repeat-associated protein